MNTLRLTLTATLCACLGLACSDDAQSGCPPCGAGTFCNGATGRCEAIQRDGSVPSGDSGASCKTTIVNACGDSQRYCSPRGICDDCPTGSWNCDGTNNCEASQDCAANGCDLLGSKTCGSSGKYCDAQSQCQACATGTQNCDLAGGTCECTSGCDGASCKKECDGKSGCGDVTKFCEIGVCKPCPTGKFNCNSADGCECEGGCDGAKCKGSQSCDFSDADVCGGDTSQWCSSNACTACSTGFFNCNKTKGCECDKAGCSGSACAGKCFGSECP
jgi:hypothetical protein